MTADECTARAAHCAANAALAQSEALSVDFLRLAAQWRAMAARQIFLGPVEPLVFAAPGLDAPLLRLS